MLLKILLILEVIFIFFRIRFGKLNKPDNVVLLLQYPYIILWHKIFTALSNINGFIIIVMFIFKF